MPVSRYHSYPNSAIQILQLYKGEEPRLYGRQAFASFIKKYFSGNKKYGSTDRKQIAHLCYCYFRLGKALSDIPINEKILTGLFLCSTEQNEMLEQLKPEWNKKVNTSIEEKYSPPAGRAGIFNNQYSIFNVFPWKDELSDGIEYEKFCGSFFIQPDLFIRIRPGNAENVLLKLNSLRVNYEFISPFTIRLPNSFKANQHFSLDKEIVVQDYSSQRVVEFLPVRRGPSDRVWDCCAGSGGKSIMIYDINSKVKLSVSDVR